MTRKFDLKLFADYFQFYLQDESAKGDLSESWTPEAVDRLLALAPGTIGIGTARNMEVPVVIEIADEPPDNTTNGWDQVNECTLEVSSGRIVVAGCSDYFPDAARIEVPPGAYRARIYYGNLNSLSGNGLDGDDHYRIVLWSAVPGPVEVIKRTKVDGRR
jgi:hypothetical protein